MLDLKTLKSSVNIADKLSDEELGKIGAQVIRHYEVDEESLGDWYERMEQALDIAKQVMETKTQPWPGASNVKFPLITKAAIDYAARAFQELVRNERIVRVNVIGADPNLEKQARAKRVATHMSFQLLKQDCEWEDGMDSLFHILPIVGTVFKKTYYNPVENKIVSELCNPDKIIVNYNVNSLESARRITHTLSFYANDVIERIRSGIYRDVDVETLWDSEGTEMGDEDSPMCILEQHCYLDLDEDGYHEPYIVTVHKNSGKVLRIVNRFKKIHKNKDGEIRRIDPDNYFVDYHFIKSPDGGFYSVGLGTILYPINESINTLINQLIDSGTLNNRQGGFIGRGLRIKGGAVKINLGEWKVLDAAAGTDIARNIVPMPTKEPSGSLFQLLGLLIDIGKDLSNSTDALTGKQNATNVPAATMMSLVEQGMKVYSAIQKRVFRALKKEFKKIFDLNRSFLKDEDYQNILDDETAVVRLDYDEKNYDILPVADPLFASDVQRMIRAQAILDLQFVDPRVKTLNFLEAMECDQGLIKQLLPPPDPNAPPPPDVMKTMAEVEAIKAGIEIDKMTATAKLDKAITDGQKAQVQAEEAKVRAAESQARINKMNIDASVNINKTQLAQQKAMHEAAIAEIEKELEAQKIANDAVLKNKEIDKKNNPTQ